MAPWPIWIRSLAQIAFLLAAFAHRVRRCIRRRRLPAASLPSPDRNAAANAVQRATGDEKAPGKSMHWG